MKMKEAREVEEGCGGCKSMEEEIYWGHIKRISFCVAFHSDFQHKLQIPKKFADNLRLNILHPKVTLRGPSRASWEVNLIRTGDGLFLQDGWEEFANAYSLQENDILFFKYDRISSFNIKIFDGECEKVAAYFVKKCGHMYPAVKNQKKRVLDELVDVNDHDNDDEVCIPTKKAHKDARIQPVNYMQRGDGLRRCSRTSKRILSNYKRVQFAINFIRKKAASRSLIEQQGRDSDAETEHAMQLEQNDSTNKEVAHQNGPTNKELPHQNGSTDKDVPFTAQNTPEVTENSSPGFEKVAMPETVGRPRRGLFPKKIASPAAVEYVSNRRRVTDEEKTQALKKAASELTDNSFFLAMQISSCYKFFFLTIPVKFASVHLGLKNQEVILRVGDKKWTTKFSFSRGGLGPGWKQFALENNLEESDACLFKLVSQENGETVMLDVSIFRVVDVVTPPTLVAARTVQ